MRDVVIGAALLIGGGTWLLFGALSAPSPEETNRVVLLGLLGAGISCVWSALRRRSP